MSEASRTDYAQAYDALLWVDEDSMEARQLEQAIESGDQLALNAAVFAVKAGFNPSQPRAAGGMWSAGGGAAAGGGGGAAGRARKPPGGSGGGGGGAHPLTGVTAAARARAAGEAAQGGATFHEHLVLNALRHHGGWVPENAPSIASSPRALEHLLKQGRIERRPGPHGTFEYRLKPQGAGGAARGAAGGASATGGAGAA